MALQQRKVERFPIPTSGIVEIKSYSNKVFGHCGESGVFTYKGTKDEIPGGNYVGKALEIRGSGYMLDMSLQHHREMLDCIMNSTQFNGIVAEAMSKRKHGNRYYLVNEEVEAEQYMNDIKRQDDLVIALANLDDEEYETLKLVFQMKPQSSINVIKMNLRQMTETAQGRKMLMEVIKNPDKEMLYTISLAEHCGNPEEHKGLYKTAQGTYMWGETTLGLGKEQVVAFLKEPKNQGLYNAIKTYITAAMGKGEFTPVSHEPSGKPEAEFQDNSDDLEAAKISIERPESFTAHDDAAIDEFVTYIKDNKQMMNIAALYMKHKQNFKHWKTLEKLIKDNIGYVKHLLGEDAKYLIGV